MAAKKLVVLGLLGHQLDQSRGRDRWDRWRPTVSLCQHEDLLIDRLELLHERKQQGQLRVVQKDLAAVSPETEVRAHETSFRDPWDFEEVYANLYQFARAYPFDTEREDYLVHMTTGTHVVQICLFLLTETRHLPARLLQTSPPPRGRPAEPGTYTIIDLDLSRYDQIATRFETEHREGVSLLKSGIETRDQSFNRQIELIEKVAQLSDAPILLMGPTGAGKSQLANRIFDLRTRRHRLEGPFVEVNCATLRGDTAMSTLFGHVKGAFTGAAADRPGLLQTAHKGILFLDEIGELGLDEQAMLLRALEEKRFLPVGADREVKSDFQLIAGTNRDLQARVAAGRFRDDLLARINLWSFTLPGLQERRADIEPNLHYELEQFSRSSGRRVTFNKEARDRYVRFATSPEAAWSGNFRDLNASVTRMATLAESGRIGTAAVADEIARLQQQWAGVAAPARDLCVDVLGEEAAGQLDRFDRVQLADVLAVCRSSKSLSDAGRRLFEESRKRKTSRNDADRLRKYLARFELAWADVRG